MKHATIFKEHFSMAASVSISVNVSGIISLDQDT